MKEERYGLIDVIEEGVKTILKANIKEGFFRAFETFITDLKIVSH